MTDTVREALRQMIRGYLFALENGRDRIISLGGDCDTMEQMERGDPYLKAARAALREDRGTETITAQHDETGRMWTGPRDQLPRRYQEIAAPIPEDRGTEATFRALLEEARDDVSECVTTRRANWGERLMHKQRPGIDLLARIDAALAAPIPEDRAEPVRRKL